jgi:hypothetical protein
MCGWEGVHLTRRRTLQPDERMIERLARSQAHPGLTNRAFQRRESGTCNPGTCRSTRLLALVFWTSVLASLWQTCRRPGEGRTLPLTSKSVVACLESSFAGGFHPNGPTHRLFRTDTRGLSQPLLLCRRAQSPKPDRFGFRSEGDDTQLQKCARMMNGAPPRRRGSDCVRPDQSWSDR